MPKEEKSSEEEIRPVEEKSPNPSFDSIANPLIEDVEQALDTTLPKAQISEGRILFYKMFNLGTEVLQRGSAWQGLVAMHLLAIDGLNENLLHEDEEWHKQIALMIGLGATALFTLVNISAHYSLEHPVQNGERSIKAETILIHGIKAFDSGIRLGVFHQMLIAFIVNIIMDPTLNKKVSVSGGVWGAISVGAAFLAIITSDKSRLIVKKLLAYCCRCCPEIFTKYTSKTQDVFSAFINSFALGHNTVATIQSYSFSTYTWPMRAGRLAFGLTAGATSAVADLSFKSLAESKYGTKIPSRIKEFMMAPSVLAIERYDNKILFEPIKFWSSGLLFLGMFSTIIECSRNNRCSEISAWELALPVYYFALVIVACGLQLLLECCKSPKHLYQHVASEPESYLQQTVPRLSEIIDASKEGEPEKEESETTVTQSPKQDSHLIEEIVEENVIKFDPENVNNFFQTAEMQHTQDTENQSEAEDQVGTLRPKYSAESE